MHSYTSHQRLSWKLLPAIAAYLIFLIILILFLPEKGHPGDLGHWKRWAIFIQDAGLANIYKYGLEIETPFACNYPPFILYLFSLSGLVMGDIAAQDLSPHWFKIIPVLFDFAGAFLVLFIVRPLRLYWWLPFLLLLNPAYLYNSYWWGQMDSILAVLAAGSLILAAKRHTYWAIALFTLALHTKLQAVVFIPVFIIALLPALSSGKELAKWILFGAAAFLLPLLLFVFNGTLDEWYTVMTSLVDQYQNLSLNAFNFWQFFHEGNGALYTKDYQEFWWGISYKTWGLTLFFLTSFVLLLPIFLRSLRRWLSPPNTEKDFLSLVLLSAYLCALAFFFFNTQMHERYSHPVLLLSFLYGIREKDYVLYSLSSVAYFLNMEAVLQYFPVDHSSLLFNKDGIAALFAIALAYGSYRLYSHREWRITFQSIISRNRKLWT